MYLDNGIFVKKLQHYDQESILIQGRVIMRNKHVDDVFDKENYLVRLEYDMNEKDDGGNAHTNTYVTNYSSAVASHHAKEMFEFTEGSSLVAMKVLPSNPTSAIPVSLLENKIKTSLQWKRYWHPLWALFGLLTYLGCCCLWLLLPDVYPMYIIISCAIGGIFFMAFSVYKKVKKVSQLNLQLVNIEPSSIPTESDARQARLCTILGRSKSRRLSLVMAIVGSFACAVYSPPFFILLFIFGFLPMVDLSSASHRRELLKHFESTCSDVPGKICSHRTTTTTGDDHKRIYYGTVQYRILRFGNLYKLKREFEGENGTVISGRG